MPERIADDAAYIAKRMKDLGLKGDEGAPEVPEIAQIDGDPEEVARIVAEHREKIDSAFYLPSGMLRRQDFGYPVIGSGPWPTPKSSIR